MSSTSNHLYTQTWSCQLWRLPRAPCSLCVCQFKHEGGRRIMIPLGLFQSCLLDMLLQWHQPTRQAWHRQIPASTKEATLLFNKAWRSTRKLITAALLKEDDCTSHGSMTQVPWANTKVLGRHLGSPGGKRERPWQGSLSRHHSTPHKTARMCI